MRTNLYIAPTVSARADMRVPLSLSSLAELTLVQHIRSRSFKVQITWTVGAPELAEKHVREPVSLSRSIPVFGRLMYFVYVGSFMGKIQ